ncbi:hypothetical protein EU546_05725 [Candidatus Thorarchaeota archaeon]|nr:MAG: hypothetical protein EU546_05725 [Candidatus Thorarchaeota archaeon]
MDKKKAMYSLLAVVLLVPWYAVPVFAQADATPELAYDLWVLSWDDISVDTGGAIETLLEEIGIDITVDIKDDGPMYEGIYQVPRQFALYEMSHGYSSVPDHVWWRMHSDNIIDWGDNCYGLDNATVDAALDDFMTSTPANLEDNAALVQQYATETIPYIPLFLSDDTHAIRKEWVNYTKKPGGIFTAFNPQTVCYMYDDNHTSGDMEFVMAYSSDIGELNPMFYRSERSHWYDMLVYDTLITYNNDLEPIPWLAEDYSISTDGTEITFTIREGVKWHDGEDLTPQDVNFTLYHYKNAPEDAIAWSFMQGMEDVEISGNDVTITMDDAYSFALQILGDLYILPEHIRAGLPADDATWDDAANATAHVGSGPFYFEERSPDEYTELLRNTDWWGPTPSIDIIRLDVVAGQDARILAMRNGDADSERYEVFGPYVQTVIDAPELDIVTGVTSQWDYVLGFNMTVPGFDDLDVRRAISLAMNRSYLIEVGRLGYGTETNTVIPQSFFPTLYDESGIFDEDVDLANEILDAAGYIDIDADGVREFPGVAPPIGGPDLLLILGIGAGALVVAVVVVYFYLKRK